jgi:hypothetical protein
MMRTRFTWSLAVGAVAAPALAQDGQGVGTWLFDVTTQDGDPIVEPGETATVSLFLDMEPSVGEQLPDGSFLYAFAAANLDVLGGDNAANGQILGWEGNDALTQLAGDTGTTDGVSIFDVHLGQIGLGISDFSDPIHLLSFEWQPIKAGAYGVEYEPLVGAFGDPGFFVWTWDGQNNNALGNEFWAIEPGIVQFQVVPAPALPTAFGLAFFACTRGRRRCSR